VCTSAQCAVVWKLNFVLKDFIFFYFTLTIYRTASGSNNTQFRIDPQSIDDRGRVADSVVNNNNNIYIYYDIHLRSRVRNSVTALKNDISEMF
jgi:hypothetical protein